MLWVPNKGKALLFFAETEPACAITRKPRAVGPRHKLVLSVPGKIHRLRRVEIQSRERDAAAIEIARDLQSLGRHLKCDMPRGEGQVAKQQYHGQEKNAQYRKE